VEGVVPHAPDPAQREPGQSGVGDREPDRGREGAAAQQGVVERGGDGVEVPAGDGGEEREVPFVGTAGGEDGARGAVALVVEGAGVLGDGPRPGREREVVEAREQGADFSSGVLLCRGRGLPRSRGRPCRAAQG
jgi:hypothetical protein